MSYNKYASEFLGAFSLTLVVWLSVVYSMPFATPVIAALTLGLFVYMVGGISGAHLNPAVTIGVWSVRKISAQDAIMYIICQFAGAAIAMTLGRVMSDQIAAVGYENTIPVLVAEAIGAFFLAFGVMSATLQKVPAAAAGLVVGGSLLLGIYVAFAFSNAVINPAVALGIGSFGPMYILGPVIGACAGCWARKLLDEHHD